jgi:type II secretory pathway pseudopilin PulG
MRLFGVNMKTRFKKRALTLLEIMIVICLITLITGVIGYNMKGSLEKGKAFRSDQARDQLHDMLLLALSEGGTADEIAKNAKNVLEKLGLARDPENLLKDGWNEPFEIRANAAKNDFLIYSRRLKNYNNKNAKKFNDEIALDESDEE